MFYISVYLEANRETYYGRLRRISAEDDWDGWIRFFLQAVIKQAEVNSGKAQDILDLYNNMKETVSEVTGSKYAIQALDAIFDRPVFNRSDFTERSGIPKSSAKRILEIMIEHEIINIRKKARGRKPALLAFNKLVDIIEESKFVAHG